MFIKQLYRDNTPRPPSELKLKIKRKNPQLLEKRGKCVEWACHVSVEFTETDFHFPL